MEPLECGHAPTPSPNTTGYATWVAGEQEERLCFPCADARMREQIRNDVRFTGYVNSAGTHITTWTGGELAKVTGVRRGRQRSTPTGGYYRMRHVTAKTPDGRRWSGRGSAAWDVINLREVRS
ncbi:hypothetical protein ABZ281_28100 [Streptomyces sp. NPDC006265]|uniref:hypothetical protein n=1 Tax=Streptomyces sp. NPDC006265 TaxID=3156740 RepID=UPI0033B281CA